MEKDQTIKLSDFTLTPYLKRSNLRAAWQILTTVFPIVGLWLLIPFIDTSYPSISVKIIILIPILSLLTLFSLRTFSLMHDCGHNSLFRTSRLNRLTGFFLGTINAIPQFPWSRDHAFHHRHNGNWEMYRGPIDVLTLQEYQLLSKRNQLLYSLSRHWIMLFPGGFFYLVIKPRLTLLVTITNFIYSIGRELTTKLINRDFVKIFSFSTRLKAHYSGYGETSGELIDLFANNIVVIFAWIFMSKWLGAGLFWSCYSVVMTFSAAIFICVFFVQHNFQDSYANGEQQWSSLLGAIKGSSNLVLPPVLNWFLADISYHSIHHLCDRIPNYNLCACHNHNENLLLGAKYLKIRDIPGCFKYILWDKDLEKLSTL